MISHEHRLIFIHIPRTAGTSFERWILGNDQWQINSAEKHLTAAEAKEAYSKHWKNYWKFSILRNTVDRFISMLKFKDHFGVTVNDDGELDISGYLRKFSTDKEVVMEHDHRFTNLSSSINCALRNGYPCNKGALYGNIIGNEMNAIFNYERLDKIVSFLAARTGLDPSDFPHSEKSIISQQSQPVVTNRTRCVIQELHSLDLYLPINPL